MRRFIVAMYASESIPLYVKECRNVTGKTKGNADLPNPPVPLAVVDGHINDLEAADQAAHNGALGAVTDRESKHAVVQSDMGLYQAYAGAQANANPERGAAIIEGGGFYVVKRVAPPKLDLAAKFAKTPGALNLFAKAKKGRVSYYWQMCVSPTSATPTTWSDLPETHLASTSVTGLTPGVTYAFRYRTMTKTGLSDWSSPVVIMAH